MSFYVHQYIISGHAFVVAKEVFHHRGSNILTPWEWLNDEKQFFLFNFANNHLFLNNNFNHMKLRYTDPCNFLTKRAFGEPIKLARGCWGL